MVDFCVAIAVNDDVRTVRKSVVIHAEINVFRINRDLLQLRATTKTFFAQIVKPVADRHLGQIRAVCEGIFSDITDVTLYDNIFDGCIISESLITDDGERLAVKSFIGIIIGHLVRHDHIFIIAVIADQLKISVVIAEGEQRQDRVLL